MSDEKKRRFGVIGSLALNGLVFVATAWWVWQLGVPLQGGQVAGLIILLVYLFGLTGLCALSQGPLTRFVSKFWLVLGCVWFLPGWFFWFLLVGRDLPEPIYTQRTLIFLGVAVFCTLEAVFLRWAGSGEPRYPFLYPHTNRHR